jgi:hypothetical protein
MAQPEVGTWLLDAQSGGADCVGCSRCGARTQSRHSGFAKLHQAETPLRGRRPLMVRSTVRTERPPIGGISD